MKIYRPNTDWDDQPRARLQGCAGGFTQPGCRDVIPCLQLCVCRFRLGDRAAAEKYNDRVGALRPEHPAYLYNKTWFKNHPA